MKTNLTNYKQDIDQMQDIVAKTGNIVQVISENNLDWLNTLKAQKERMDGEYFRVLVMGRFNAGKSTMINALLGEKVLPESACPATAIITEILYGENKRVVMYPKAGKWPGGDEPFEISVEDMGKYCLIDNEAEIPVKLDEDTNVIESPFEKMVVYWPLPILRDGVMLIDSPGLDDPYNHDAIAQNYAPQSAAIIYLVGEDGLGWRDEIELRRLNELGFCSMMMVLTHFDQALSKLEEAGQDPEEFKNEECGKFARYSDLGREGCHFVDSRSGLKAKIKGDEKMQADSGYENLESYLARYLVENKGRSLIHSVASQVGILHREMRVNGEALVNTQNAKSEELLARAETAEKKLEVAKMQGETVVVKYETIVDERIRPKAYAKAEYFADDFSNRLTLEGFEPTTKIPKGVQRLNAKATRIAAKQLKEETLQYLRHQTQMINKVWNEKTLNPLIDHEMRLAAQAIGQDVKMLVDDLGEVYKGLDPQGKEKMFNGKDILNAISTLILVMTGSWLDALVCGVYGVNTFVKTIGFGALNLMAYVLLTGTVMVTLPVTLSATLIGFFMAVMTGASGQEKSIKNAALKQIRKAFDQPEEKEKRKQQVKDYVDRILDLAVKQVRCAIQSDIDKANTSVTDMKKNALLSSEERSQMAKRVAQALDDLNGLEEKIGDIVSKYQ